MNGWGFGGLPQYDKWNSFDAPPCGRGDSLYLLLVSFAMRKAFLCSDYYDTSDSCNSLRQIAHLCILPQISYVHEDDLYRMI